MSLSHPDLESQQEDPKHQHRIQQVRLICSLLAHRKRQQDGALGQDGHDVCPPDERGAAYPIVRPEHRIHLLSVHLDRVRQPEQVEPHVLLEVRYTQQRHEDQHPHEHQGEAPQQQHPVPALFRHDADAVEHPSRTLAVLPREVYDQRVHTQVVDERQHDQHYDRIEDHLGVPFLALPSPHMAADGLCRHPHRARILSGLPVRRKVAQLQPHHDAPEHQHQCVAVVRPELLRRPAALRSSSDPPATCGGHAPPE